MTSARESKTAVITGASSGLGAEFARQLAARGFNLVIAARRENNLQQIADTLESRYSIHVQVQPSDLSLHSDIQKLVETITSLSDLEILVNSAGFGTVGKFYQVDPLKEQAMLNVHVLSLVLLSRAALPQMVSRKRGTIINVSSIAGLIAIRNVLYHSTKSFQIHFSEVLQAELRNTGVQVQALCPGFTMSGFHDTPEYTQFKRSSVPRFLWMSSEQVVAESLHSLSSGRLYCFPGTINKIAGSFARNSITAGMIKLIGSWIVSSRRAL